jgi:endonuclease/exonuclease/phosphatase family metal-dependent hydrolase
MSFSGLVIQSLFVLNGLFSIVAYAGPKFDFSLIRDPNLKTVLKFAFQGIPSGPNGNLPVTPNPPRTPSPTPAPAPIAPPTPKPTGLPASPSGPSPIPTPSSVPVVQANPLLRVATWNLKRLGHGTKRLDLVAQVMESQFDVVALNEVMTLEGIRALSALLPQWRYEVSSRAVGTDSYTEYYAVFYRHSVASLTRSFVVPDPQNQWVREPMVACLAAGRLSFCLVMAHIIYGNTVGPRDLEITALANLVKQLRQTGPEKDYITLGDFNRVGNVASFTNFSREGFIVTNFGNYKTTLGTTAYANPYDHVLIDPSFTNQWTGHVGKYDLVAGVCNQQFDWCAANVSDHAPYGIILDTRMDDRY